MMNFEDMFNMIDEKLPESMREKYDTEANSSGQYNPTYVDPFDTSAMNDMYMGFKTNPVLYNIDGYISPYPANNWGWTGNSSILQYVDDPSRLPALENKIDPNKIFSSEINALRSLAADQQKITKMFEKRLMESLTEKGKTGLTEEDVEAMSALTAARSAITSINKEQVNIKKNIADIRVKQNQTQNTQNQTQNGSVSKVNNIDVGRSILDNIFDTPTNTSVRTDIVDYKPSTDANPDALLDSIVPTTNPHIAFESSEPTTYVVLGDSDDDIEYVTYGTDGNIIPDYPAPNTKITNIDRDAGKATDELLVQYPIKLK